MESRNTNVRGRDGGGRGRGHQQQPGNQSWRPAAARASDHPPPPQSPVQDRLVQDRPVQDLPVQDRVYRPSPPPVQERVYRPAPGPVQERVYRPAPQPVQEPVYRPAGPPVQERVYRPAAPPVQERVYRPSPSSNQKPVQSGGGSVRSSGEASRLVASPTDAIEKRLGAVSISEQIQPSSSSSLSTSGDKIVPMKRPDKGSRVGKPIKILVNHFPVKFNPNATIIHYHLDVKRLTSSDQAVKRTIPKSDLALIREKLSFDDPERFPLDKTAYDGEKSIFSTVNLPVGQFNVQLMDGDLVVPREYIITIKCVNELKLSKLKHYLNGSIAHNPRDILAGMDVVMKDNPSRTRISSGRHFYSKEFRRGDDFHNGVAAYRGFQQSLKPTGQGLVLCLDFCVMPFHKPMPVLEFLKEHVRGFNKVNDVLELKRYVVESLKGLKVSVTHRRTKQKYTVKGLSNERTRDIFFEHEDLDGNNPPRRVGLVDYFREKYDYEIMHQQIPSLDIGRGQRKNYVPLELCEVVVGQRYPKEYLSRNHARLLKEISLPPPMERKNTILEIMRSEDGPTGVVTENFEIGVAMNMTAVMGRVLTAPHLKLASQDGAARKVSVDSAKAHWNLTDKSVSAGKALDRWALIDFGASLDADGFVMKLKKRCGRLGMSISNPAVVRRAKMQMLSSVDSLEKFLNDVVQEAGRASNLKLQMIVCSMADTHNGYKYLKWLETRIGVVTQCCLSDLANKGNDQYLANLALKINAKLGGSNVELIEGVPYFRDDYQVMFIGADVNHPPASNKTCPSIAAVVGSINWPVANQYAARICPQTHRKENIITFGAMCLELVNAYHRCNGVMPLKIVLFRDGVSEGQFDMVLNEELLDLKKTFQERNYYPMITVVVAQKRHQTRLFLDVNDGSSRPPVGNVPPGTVVDSTIVHPFEFDFYCVSHYGALGRVSQHTTIVFGMRINSVPNRCRSSSTIYALPLHGAQSLFHLFLLYIMLTLLLTEAVCSKRLKWSDHLQLWLVHLTRVSTINTQTSQTTCFLFDRRMDQSSHGYLTVTN